MHKSALRFRDTQSLPECPQDILLQELVPYCAWNPVKSIDPDGKEVSTDPYLIYNGKTHKLEIWDDNQTSDDYSDDVFIGSYDAHNEVASNSKGKWPDGKYDKDDTKNSHTHGQATDKKSIKLDSKNGSYGEGGIYRAKSFKQDNGVLREGMGIHSGRDNVTNFSTCKVENIFST